MKWLIASDIHGAFDYCEQLMEAYEDEKADKILLLGDLLYHGPRNAFPSFYDTQKCADMLNAEKENIVCVRGNCDAEVDQVVLEFPIMADFTIINEDGIMMFASHGHIYNEYNIPYSLGSGGVLLNGHTHMPACIPHKDFIYMNPGSVSIPKGGSYNGYMTYENRVFTWKDLKGKVKNTYKMKEC